MSDAFRLQGSYTITPLGSPTSFAQSAEAVIDESVTFDTRLWTELALTVDSAVAVDFGSLDEANVIILKAVGGKVRARLTSTDGSQQAVPFDTYFILMSDTVGITALDLTRVAGTDTTVRIFLGQKA